MKFLKTSLIGLAAFGLSTSAHAAVLAAGDVIAVDISTAGGSAANFNTFNSTTTIAAGSVIRWNGANDIIDGVSLTFAGQSGFNNDGNANAWPGTAADPYYVAAADDISYGNGPGSLTVSGLDPSLSYNVRIYSLIGNNGGVSETFSVTDGGGFVSNNPTRGTRWNASTLEAGGTVFNGVSANGSNSIVVTSTAGSSNTFFNAVVVEAIPEPSSAAFIGLMGLGLILRRRRN